MPYRSRHFLPLLWLCVILAGGLPDRAAGQSWAGQYSLREWHAQDGLPSDDVTRVHQDRAGYLWLVTARGLARFDGAYFEDFGPGLKQAGSAVYIRAITETPELGVVVAPISGGTLAFKDGAFRRLDFAADKVVNSLFAEADGTLWASCDDQSLLRWQAGRTEEFRPNEGSPHRLVAHFAADLRGRMLIAGGTMIGRYESGRVEVINAEFGGPEFRVTNSRQGGPWILTVDRLLKMGEGGVKEIATGIPLLVGAHYASVLHEDRHGTLWIGTRSQGLYAVVDGRFQLVPTSDESISGICEDTEGGIWVTTKGGLNRLRRRDFKVYDRAAGLGDNYSFTVSEDAEGSVWFGNRDGGLARLRDGKIETFTNRPGQPQGSVTSVLPDGRGRVWVTTGLGVLRFDPTGAGRLEPVTGIPAKPSIGVAYVARNGDYWVGLTPDRVGRYREGRFETFGPAEGFVGQAPRAITEDEQGGILIGTADGKLIRYDGRRFAALPLDVKVGEVEPIQDIYSEPGTGLTWIATAGNGVYVLGGGRLQHIRAEDGLIATNITTILPDDQGYLWLGSPVGIFSLRRQELAELLAGRISRVHPIIVGRDDGMHGLTCLGLYKPAAWKGRDGRLWFATRKGVVNFNPARAITDTASPPAVVAAVSCDDEARVLQPGGLEISARVRKLALRLSVLCLSTPDRVQIKYRLDGFDSQWITAGPDRTVVYPRLPPGRYSLRTMASLGNGVWNEADSALLITVVPLWWQTLWFRLLVAVVLMALVIVVVRTVSHRRLRARLERLEQESAIERERARIARNIHDDLGASLTRISLLTQMARRDGPAPENPQLNQIYETVRQITRSMDEIVWAVNPKNDHLDSLATYLGGYAQSFLSVAGIRCRLDLPDHLPAVALTSQTRHNLYLCLKEALNNVVKHSGADEVTITMRTEEDRFTMLITDNGRQPARTGVNGANGHGADHGLRVSSGHGRRNIAQRVAEMGGTHEFTPAGEGQGARLAISIALGAARAKNSPPSGLI